MAGMVPGQLLGEPVIVADQPGPLGPALPTFLLALEAQGAGTFPGRLVPVAAGGGLPEAEAAAAEYPRLLRLSMAALPLRLLMLKDLKQEAP